MVELGGEAALDVGPHLGAQPEHQPAAARRLQIPCAVRHREGGTRERHCDVRPDPEPFGHERGLEQREERVVARLDRPERVEPDPLEPDGFRTDSGQGDLLS